MYLIQEGKINNLYEYLLHIEKSYGFYRSCDGDIKYNTYENNSKENSIQKYYEELQRLFNHTDEELRNEVINSYNNTIKDYNNFIKEKTEYLDKLNIILNQFKDWNLTTEKGIEYKNKIKNKFIKEINDTKEYIKLYNDTISKIKSEINNFNINDYKVDMINYYNERINKTHKDVKKEYEFIDEENKLLKDYEKSLIELKTQF